MLIHLVARHPAEPLSDNIQLGRPRVCLDADPFEHRKRSESPNFRFADNACAFENTIDDIRNRFDVCKSAVSTLLRRQHCEPRKATEDFAQSSDGVAIEGGIAFSKNGFDEDLVARHQRDLQNPPVLKRPVVSIYGYHSELTSDRPCNFSQSYCNIPRAFVDHKKGLVPAFGKTSRHAEQTCGDNIIVRKDCAALEDFADLGAGGAQRLIDKTAFSEA
ncbi:hypothetical protein [Rhizobium laguerreae]|uniref:hypothetical protein n=1 Tax=Rhizobium laguerreae TaxID=1076926 RepID=UPI001C91B733|nr:hypothetical protein [Rhizobium laguerreae]